MNDSVIYNSSFDYGKLSGDTVDKLKLAAYYGYGYGNHSDPKWYAITQMLMWRFVEPNTNIYFTNGLNGIPTNNYDTEVNELKTLINNHYIRPSFNNTTNNVNINEKLTLTDYNHVLANYDIVSTDGLTVNKDNNNLYISGAVVGNYNIKLIKKSNLYNSIPIFYLNNNSQDLLITGNVNDIVSNLNINITGGYININKVDTENKLCKNQGEAKLQGAKYNIINYENKIVDTITIDSNCQARSSLLPYGEYKIKELSAGYGYNLDNTEYHLILNKTENNIELSNAAKKSKIKINKAYENKDNNDYTPENNIDFGIYDSFNKLLKTITTDINGYAEIDLPYGHYVIKQLTTTKNYLKVRDIDISINDDANKEINLELKDKMLSAKLKVFKKDAISKKIIRGITKFKIYNKTLQLFMKDSNGNEMFVTNNDGVLITNMYFKAGDYCLYEEEAPNGYQKATECLDFSVDDNNRFIYYNDELFLEVNFYDYQQTPKNSNNSTTIKIPDTLCLNVFDNIILYEKKVYI